MCRTRRTCSSASRAAAASVAHLSLQFSSSVVAKILSSSFALSPLSDLIFAKATHRPKATHA